MEDKAIDILLVEDNFNDAELTIRVLRKSSTAINIVHLRDGAAALDFLFGEGDHQGRNVSIKPKLILLDLKMPKVSGIEVLEKVKSSNLTKAIPIVVLTSSREHPDVERAYDLGVNSYIVKPVDFKSFKKKVSDLGIYWLTLNQDQG